MAMVVYDVTCEESFNACVQWIEKSQKEVDTRSIIGKV